MRSSDWSSDVCSSGLPARIAGLRLERVAEGMAEVEQGAAPARLVLVLADDARFRGYRMRDRVHPRLGIAREQRGAVRLAPREEFGIVDQPVFDDLGIARAGFSGRQRVEIGRASCRERVCQYV